MKNIFGFILGLIFCLIFVEAYVSNSFVMDKYMNDYDPEIGRIRKANTPYVRYNEGFGVGKINEYNYLNKEYPIEKSVNSIRIALMGDSYVESFQVFDRHYFGRIMENILSEKFNQPVEVLNFGRSGFDIGDCYAYYNTLVAKFNPDFVVYILGFDDFSIRNSEKLLPFVKANTDSVIIERKFQKSKYLKNYLKAKPFLIGSVLINNLNKGRKLLTKEYVLPQLLDKFYLNKNDKISKKETKEVPIITLTPEISNIVSILQKNRGFFFLRTDIEIENSIFTFRNIDQIFKNKEYNPYVWKIAKTSGHWNNRAHRDIGEYMAKEVEKIIRTEQGLVTNGNNNHE